MRSGNNGTVPKPAESDSVNLDPAETVIVPTGGGKRFHRSDGPGFDTVCKTGFSHPIRKVSVADATQEGFTPCEKPACFG